MFHLFTLWKQAKGFFTYNTTNKGVFSMKTRKQFSTKKVGSFATAKLLATMLCIVAALAVIGCEEDEPDPPPPQEQPIDYITYNAVQIPIYKTDGVSDAEATTAVNNIKTAFNSNLMQDYRDKFSTGVKKIYLLAGDSEALYSFDKATGILKVGSGWTWDTYAAYFKYVVTNILSQRSRSGVSHQYLLV
jgi:hypothetical protein